LIGDLPVNCEIGLVRLGSGLRRRPVGKITEEAIAADGMVITRRRTPQSPRDPGRYEIRQTRHLSLDADCEDGV